MTGPRVIASVILALSLIAGCAPRTEPAGPAITAPRLADDHFIAADGAKLPVRYWPSTAPERAVIIGLHGFNDYSNAFDAPAAFWSAQGIATYAYDQRGFGAAPHPGIWAGTDTMTMDLGSVVTTVRARHPGRPVYLVGVSMGGAVALAAVTGAKPPAVDGAVLVAPAVWGRRNLTMVSRSLLWMLSNSMPWLTLTGQGLQIKPSDNTEMLRALGRDKKVIKETRVDAIKGLVDLMDDAFAATAHINLPVLFLYGERDEVVPKKATFDALKQIPESSMVRTALYPNGYHMLLRDLQAGQVLKDIATWVGDPTAPLPSGAERDLRTLLAAD